MAEGFSLVEGEVMEVERGDSILDTSDSMHDMTTDSLESFSVGFGRGVTFSDEEMLVEGEGGLGGRDEVTLSPERAGMPVERGGARGVGRGDGGWGASGVGRGDGEWGAGKWIGWGVGRGMQREVGAAGGEQREVGGAEGVQREVGGAGGMQREAGSGVQREVGAAGGEQREVGEAGGVQREVGGTGGEQREVGGAGGVQREVGKVVGGPGGEQREVGGAGGVQREVGTVGGGKRVDGRRRGRNVQRGKGELFVVGNERGGVECVVCGDHLTGNIEFHMMARHVPWFVKPDTACWRCKRQFLTKEGLEEHFGEMEGGHGGKFVGGRVLEQWCSLMGCLLEGLAGVYQLRNYTQLWEWVERKLGEKGLAVEVRGAHYQWVFRNFGDFVGSGHGEICHWARVAVLLSGEGVEGRKWERGVEGIKREVGEGKVWGEGFGDMNSGVVDAHCHLDRMLQELRIRGVADLGLGQRWGVVKNREGGGDLNLNAMVTSLCYPKEWGVVGELRRMVQQDGVHLYWTVGVHPKEKFGEGDKIKWEGMLKDGRCVGVGEVGLDRRGDASQAKSLEFGTRLAVRHNKALVVHCRGEKEFHERARGIIRGAGGSNLRIYVHSFTGGEEQCEGWIRIFPRVVFGVGKLAVREGHGGWVVGRTDRVVLETDAPYLGVKGEGRLHSPFMVREWVGWLCRTWNLPRRVVSMILERNVVGLYELHKK